MNHFRLDLTELLALEHGDFRFFSDFGSVGKAFYLKNGNYDFFLILSICAWVVDL